MKTKVQQSVDDIHEMISEAAKMSKNTTQSHSALHLTQAALNSANALACLSVNNLNGTPPEDQDSQPD